ncbi:hypothetical protein NP493_734g02011 [Ridgeia piscesae]|uniref:HEAT repeat containing 5B n=1 Tax=Ridgeia piscesae TaxID=27915 RepID=A0AAD9KQ35_RIDPI|nr:hypothetical protein NP493_734g02011 [Ridgeia piscesae]
MFRGYVEPTLSLVLQLLLSVPPSSVDVHQCLGRCLAALITTLGPELQGNSSSVATARLSCLVCCAIMQDHYDSIVQAEAILCLQQCHLFAPRHVNLSTLVPHLCVILSSPHLLLRRAAMSCLRQLSQREAKEVFDHALALAAAPSDGRDRVITETGLEGALFSMLDKETDPKLCSDIQDTVVSMLQSLAVSKLTRWLQLIKAILQASSDAGSLNSPVDDGDAGQKEDDDDEAGLAVKSGETEGTRPTVAPRWPTRVFAVECLLKIMALCPVSLSDVDPAQVVDPASGGKVECLVSHLSELVRMAFIAATSDCDKLRLAGLAALQEIITKFAKVPEPEFPGHVILEQYQAQVGAALRPAFSPDTAPDVTSAACEVCSCWIGSGVARDLNDLRRVHQLLVSSLAKLKEGRDTTPLYSESASTMEKLSVLRAWAEVYMVAMDRESEKRQKVKQTGDEEEETERRRGVFSGGESLLSLVQPEMKTLSKQWLAALKDHALLSLPSEYSGQLPPDGGTFYTMDTMNAARTHYRKTWPPILYAASLWLKEAGFTSVDKDNSKPANMQADEGDTDRFHLLMGICVEAMCSPTSVQPLQTIMLCLKSIYTLLDDPWPRSRLGVDSALSIELLNVLHRLLLTRDSTDCFLLILDVVRQVVKSAEENLEIERTKLREERESKPANAVRTSDDSSDAMTHTTQLKSATVGDGGESGDIVPGKSIVFATLEVCLYVLVRHVPALNPSIPSTGFQTASVSSRWTEDTCQLMSTALQIMSQLPALCTPRGSVSILPTELFLMTGVIKELAPVTAETVPSVVTVVLQCLKTLCASSFTKDPACSADWVKLLQSSVATVLDFAKPDATRDHVGVDTSTLLLTLTVFTVSSPASVMRAPNLLQPTVGIFKDAWSSKSHEVRLKCLQTLGSICQLPDNCLSTPFIHGVVPAVIEFLLGVPRSRPSTDPELAVALEGVRLMESLVALAEDNTRIHLVSVLVPMLVSYLLDGDTLKMANKTSVKLHDSALQSLMKIGPQYPAHFRSVMQSSPDLRSLLEGAVKVQKERGSGTDGRDGSKAALAASSQPAKPTITLKTNFGNFTG